MVSESFSPHIFRQTLKSLVSTFQQQYDIGYVFNDQVLFLLAGVAADPGVDLVGLLVPFLAGVASGVLAEEEEDGCEAATTSSSEFSSPSESDTSGVTFPICKL